MICLCESAALVASSSGKVIATALGGIVAVIVVSAVFYAIGRGEDRQRSRDEAMRRAKQDEPETAEVPATRPEHPRAAVKARWRRRP